MQEKEVKLTGSTDIYSKDGGTQVDLVVPLSFIKHNGRNGHIRMPLKFFSGELHNTRAYEFASEFGASCVPLYSCRIFHHDEQ